MNETVVAMKDWEDLTPLEQAHGLYSDMYKDAYDMRPCHDVSEWTLEDFQREFEVLEAEIKLQIQRDREDQARAVEQAEKRIAEMIALGAGNRETAMRWLHEAEGTNGDDEFMCYNLGLPYGYFRKAVVA